MKSPWLRNSLLGLSFLAVFGTRALALGYGLVATTYSPFAETVYGIPTSYVSAASYLYPTSYYAPTSYVYSGSYAYPTSYYYPTVYSASSYVLSPTSYAVPTYYTASSYVVPRRYVASPVYSTALTYAPSAYYYPTVISSPMVASSTACNEVISVPAPSRVRSNPGITERAPEAEVPANEPPYRAEENPVRSVPDSSAVPPLNSGTPAPPTSPVPPEPEATSPPAPTTLRRQAQKPVVPVGRSPVRNILEGKVLSSDTREAEEGVRVIVSSRPGNFVDRVATTDAFGHYAVRLPDGDWTVKVAMPSGRVYPVSQITISGGQITDSYGQDIPSLIITR